LAAAGCSGAVTTTTPSPADGAQTISLEHSFALASHPVGGECGGDSYRYAPPTGAFHAELCDGGFKLAPVNLTLASADAAHVNALLAALTPSTARNCVRDVEWARVVIADARGTAHAWVSEDVAGCAPSGALPLAAAPLR